MTGEAMPWDDEMAAKCEWCGQYSSFAKSVSGKVICSRCAIKPDRVGELNRDVMECGDPQDAWAETIKHFRWRANVERGIAHDLRQTAEAAAEDATIHAARAHEFTDLANAMERAPIAFAASVDTLPEGGDAQQGSVRSKGSAVPERQTPQPHPKGQARSNKSRKVT